MKQRTPAAQAMATPRARQRRAMVLQEPPLRQNRVPQSLTAMVMQLRRTLIQMTSLLMLKPMAIQVSTGSENYWISHSACYTADTVCLPRIIRRHLLLNWLLALQES